MRGRQVTQLYAVLIVIWCSVVPVVLGVVGVVGVCVLQSGFPSIVLGGRANGVSACGSHSKIFC